MAVFYSPKTTRSAVFKSRGVAALRGSGFILTIIIPHPPAKVKGGLLLTIAKICAIIYKVRVPTMEYGGSLNKVKEVIVHGIHNLCRPGVIHHNAYRRYQPVLSDLLKKEVKLSF